MLMKDILKVGGSPCQYHERISNFVEEFRMYLIMCYVSVVEDEMKSSNSTNDVLNRKTQTLIKERKEESLLGHIGVVDVGRVLPI